MWEPAPQINHINMRSQGNGFCCQKLPFREGEKALGDAFASGFGAADQEDGVFTRDCTENVRIAFGIDCFGDWLCAGDDGLDDD